MAFHREDLENGTRWKIKRVYYLHHLKDPPPGQSNIVTSVLPKIDRACLIGTLEFYAPQSEACKNELKVGYPLKVAKIFGVLIIEEWWPKEQGLKRRMVYGGQGWVYCDRHESDITITCDASETQKIVTVSVMIRRSKTLAFKVKIECKSNEKEGRIIP